jgi:BolA-like protein 1
LCHLTEIFPSPTARSFLHLRDLAPFCLLKNLLLHFFANFRKIERALAPVSLSVVNDSHKHAGHAGNPSGAADAETHFQVSVVSEAFEGKPLVARHRIIYELLSDELKAGLHALALKTKTPTEG